MRFVVIFLVLTAAANTSAAVYKWVKPDGSVVYSDRAPVENAAPTELPALQEIKMPPPPPSPTPSTTPAAQTEGEDYTSLAITEPADNSAFRNNAGQINVKLALDPALQQGDAIVILLDGKEIGRGRSTALSLSNVDRGTHSLQASVKDADGTTLISSNPITFTLQRTSVLLRKH
ncbi:MAG: DUF4124 domain-containing protein [Gammaproteobacteria bacterium]|jgi:hypothetical protein